MVEGSISDVLIGVGGGGISVGSVAWYFFQRMFTRQDKLEERIHRIEEQDLQEVKKRVTKIEDGCRAEANAQAIDSFRPVLARIEAKLDSTAQDLASIEGKMASWEGWISDVRKEEREIGARLIQHMTDARSHGGRDDAR